jgi:hypothetical protein
MTPSDNDPYIPGPFHCKEINMTSFIPIKSDVRTAIVCRKWSAMKSNLPVTEVGDLCPDDGTL